MKRRNEPIDIYRQEISLAVKKRPNKNKIMLILIIIFSLILISLITVQVTKILKEAKIVTEYQNQLISLKEQEEQKAQKIEEEKEAKRVKYTDKWKQSVEHIYSSDKKRAFLTFDDGPSDVTPIILDTLKQENIKATFFVLGQRVEQKPDMVKRMYDEGHFIANHGYSHVYDSIYSSKEAVLDEFNKCNIAVQNAIGDNEYNSHLFRFPGGSIGGKYSELKLQAKDLLKQNGIESVDWNALNGDAETNDLTPEFELERLQGTVQGKNSVVILMHDSPLKKVTAESLSQLIGYLRNEGYEFNNFYDLET